MSAAVIRRELRRLGDRSRARFAQRFFRTGPGEYGAGDRFLGITVPVLRRVARARHDLPLKEAATLLRSPWHEERLLALLILVRQHSQGTPRQRDAIHRLYLRNRRWVNNWDLVDCSAERIVGAHLGDGDRALLERLVASRSVWDRRMAIIATFHYIRQGEYRETLRLAEALLDDSHDLIHKAVGWMLREVGKRNRAVEERFLRRHASRMPRTMLRYAIERFPPAVRRRYLAAGKKRPAVSNEAEVVAEMRAIPTRAPGRGCVRAMGYGPLGP